MPQGRTPFLGQRQELVCLPHGKNWGLSQNGQSWWDGLSGPKAGHLCAEIRTSMGVGKGEMDHLHERAPARGNSSLTGSSNPLGPPDNPV